MDAIVDESPALDALRDDRAATQRAAMTVLGTWSAVNLGVGTALALTAKDDRDRGFWAASAGWNVVNAGIVVGSLVGASRETPAPWGTEAARQDALERALLVNTGLDVAYVLGGLLLREVGARKDRAQWVGAGEAVALQGGFLFAFDLGFYLSARRVGRRFDAAARWPDAEP